MLPTFEIEVHNFLLGSIDYHHFCKLFSCFYLSCCWLLLSNNNGTVSMCVDILLLFLCLKEGCANAAGDGVAVLYDKLREKIQL